jgi:hypothetical protein
MSVAFDILQILLDMVIIFGNILILYGIWFDHKKRNE